jgi:hypothetical protein
VLAEVINQGLRRVEKDMDYVLICGADNVVPPEFFEVLSKRMKTNPKLVIASGRCKGEPYNKNHPRGTRVVGANFWRRINGLLYPVVPGWESWLCFKAAQLGYEVRAFRDVVTEPQRPTKSVYVSVATARSRGESMYALGYDWIYALGRCVITFLKNPRAGLSMFLGWLLHKGVGRLDVADWVGQMQKESFWRRVRSIIKRGGRK